MSAAWTTHLFPGGVPLVYTMSLAGKPSTTQWTIYRGIGTDGLHEIEFLAEIDPAAWGGGGALIRQRSRLWCTDGLDPVRYTSEAQSTRLTLQFARDVVKIELPDDTAQTIARDSAEFIVDGNLPGQAALFYAELANRGSLRQPVSVRLFLVPQLVTVPSEIAPSEIALGKIPAAKDPSASSGLWYRTSHREDVLLDPQGRMLDVRIPHLGSECSLRRPGPSPPNWPEDLRSPSLTYAPPQTAQFSIEDVSIAGPVTPIGATLTIPRAIDPVGGVLFLSGSGTHDRHGISGEIDLGTHEIMDDLADHGFVGLRFDTRGAGSTRLGSDMLDRGLTSDIADARACLAFLRQRPEVAGRPLFLIGHSQGGMEALALANKKDVAPWLAGIVLMAAPGRTIDEVLADQIVAQGETIGFTQEQIGRQLEDLKQATRLVRSGRPWRPGEIPDWLLALFRTRTWYQEMLSCDTRMLIAGVTCPALACQGGTDFQVSPTRDAEVLVAAARSGNVDCGYAFFPGLDHLFKRSIGRSTLAEYYQPRPVDGAFLSRLRAWLDERAGVIAA
ncbi:MAG: alpha/beta hydrolase family protein [Xanthobacteraceae bacterium]